MSDQAQIEGLHQRAAESYLQGQFEEALGSWRELLGLDPQDERAIEGIRLCELIVQQAGDPGFDDDPADDPESATDHQPVFAEGSDVDFEQIARMLEGGKADDAGPGQDDPGWDFSAFDAPGPAGGSLDLADLPDLMREPAAGGGEAATNAAEDVVEGRIAELLSSASTSFDAGDVEGALTLLDRVFILDEDNPTATALAAAFRRDIEARDQPRAGSGPVPDAEADETLEALGVEGVAGSGRLVARPPEVGLADGALDGLDVGLDDAHVRAQASAPEAGAGEGLDGRRASGGLAGALAGRPRLLIGSGVVLVLAVAALAGMRLTGSPSTEAAPAPVVRKVEPAAAPAVDPSGGSVGEVAQDVATAEPRPAHTLEDLPSLMARAQKAFEAGDFSSAVVTYNEALQLAPHDPVALRGLASAGAAYQEQRKFMDKLEAATDAYTQGEYRKALQLFYRLPETEGVPRFDRFKANGWYSLAVNALQTGACSDARSHLAEAVALLPNDSGIAAAARLAKSCATSQGDPVWLAEVQRLTVRGLDD